jgi:APA family basic amino acid/polyamine antiporter
MLGTANAWTLASAQISLGLAQEKLLPDFFGKKNKESAPYASVLVSSIGMLPILILSRDKNLSEQISSIIDFSVEAFLLVYAVCCLAFIKINTEAGNTIKTIFGSVTFAFCLTMIINSSIKSVCVALLFAASGIFMLPFVFTVKKTRLWQKLKKE